MTDSTLVDPTKNEAFYQVTELPVNDILADENFNVRGEINRNSVHDLVTDIHRQGLQQPIVVKEYQDLLKKYKYRVIAGHRRFLACCILGHKTVPCFIRNGLDPIDERAINIGENVKRKNLTLVQEAKGVRDMIVAGATIDQVANAVSESKEWVQLRLVVNNFPDTIKQSINLGLLNMKQIKDLVEVFAIVDEERLVRLANEYVDKQKSASDTKKFQRFLKRIAPTNPEDRESYKRRDTADVLNMLEVLGTAIDNNRMNPDHIAIKLIRFFLSKATTAEVFRAFKEEVAICGGSFEIPAHYITGEEREAFDLGITKVSDLKPT